MAASACQWFGVAIETTSMSLSSTTLRMSCSYFGAFPWAFSIGFIALPITASSQSQTVVISQLSSCSGSRRRGSCRGRGRR